MTPPTPTPETLLSHAAWIRILARALVRDEHAADDIAQDAIVVALEHPHALDRSPHAWFARVVHNLAHTHSRAETRRKVREFRSFADWTSPSPEELYEHAEWHRRLVEAVMQLDEPYRSTILLRYFEEQSPSEIAQRNAIPVRTVNTRLQRGLDQLRARLDRESGGDRRSWLCALVPLAGRSSSISTAYAGVMIMSAKLKVALFVFFILALTVGYVVMTRRESSPGAFAVATGASSSESRDHSALALTTPDALTDSLGDSRSRILTREAPLAALDRELVGKVTTAAGHPIDNAHIQLRTCDGRGFAQLDAEYARNERLLGETTSDPRGVFRFAGLERARPYDLYIDAAGFAAIKLPNRFAAETVPVILQPGAELRGQVTHSSDGSPCSSARVVLGAGILYFEGHEEHETRTDTDGRYRFVRLAPDAWTIRVEPVDGSTAHSIAVLSSGTSCKKDIVIAAAATISGRVVDARTGAAVRGAVVQDRFYPPLHSTSSDSEGRFLLAGLDFRGTRPVRICARAIGFAEQERQVTLDAKQEGTIEFALTPGREIRGRVLDTSGEPLDSAFVALVAQDESGRTIGERASGRTGADGTFRWIDIRRDAPHAVFVRKPGFGNKLYELGDADRADEALDLGDLSLEKASTLRGRIRDENGNVVPGIIVSLDGSNSDRARFSRAELPGIERTLAHRETHADELGRFNFADLSSGVYTLAASIKGSATSAQTGLSIRPNDAIEDFVLELEVGEVIEGHIVDPDGKPIASADVDVFAEGDEMRRLTYNLTRGDGSFRLQGLKTGIYTLCVDLTLFDRNDPSKQFPRGRWEGIHAGDREVQLQMSRPAWISGTVLNVSGQPAEQAEVQARVCGETTHEVFPDARDQSDAQGRFRLLVKDSSCVDIHVFTADSSGLRVAEIGDLTAVRAGATDVVLRLHKFE
jgi:RNA polymerase sigma-70 factor (ECF subfamily)